MNTKRLALGVTLSLIAAVLFSGPAAAAQSATVTVDFGQTLRSIAPVNYGASITGYGEGHFITNDAVHRGHLQRLGLGTMRFELAYRTSGDGNSGLMCGGLNCHTEIPGQDWVTAMRQAGSDPMIILPLDGRHAAEIDRTDAVNIYRYFANGGNPVRKFIVGNEHNHPDNVKKMDATEYSRRFNMIVDAIRAIDATVQFVGPTTAWYDAAYIETFLNQSGDRVNFVDMHYYPQGEGKWLDDATTLGKGVRDLGIVTTDLRAQINRVRPDRAAQIGITIGEYNMAWSADTRQYTQLSTLWGAATLGTAFAAGATIPIEYGDKAHGGGLTGDVAEQGYAVNEPLPLYHGIGMFSGEGVFRGFGSSMVKATSSNGLLYAFASTNEKNIVLVNTATEVMTTSLALTGFTNGSAEVWQVTNGRMPQRNGSVSISGSAGSISLPARSVTTLVLGAAAPQPATGLSATYFDNMDLTGTTVSRVDSTVNFNWGLGAPVAGIAADTFSARWTGQVQVDTAGTYTFIATTDDGSRLWIDGTQVVNAWVDHGSRDDSGQIMLTAGKHTVRFEYYENTYDAVAQLSWSGPGLARQIIPTGKLTPAVNGLTGTYFDNMDLTGTTVSRVDSTVNFNWGTGSPAASIGAETFSARWTGQVQADTAGMYTFIATTDDGSRLWIDGTQVVNAWVDHGSRDDSGQITLTAGKHDVKFEYYENGYDAVAQLSWSGPGLARQIIPNGKLWTDPATPPPPTGTDPISSTTGLWLDPNNYAAVWARDNSGDSRAAKIGSQIGTRPMAAWYGNWNSNIAADVNTHLNAAAAAGNKLAVLVAYNIPNRDCGGHSGGGAGTPEAYRTWISAFASAIGTRPAIVVIEPDAAPQIGCLPTEADKQIRVDLLKYATEQLRDKAPNAWSYLDIGNKGWLSAGEAATLLDRAGGRNVHGFSLNVSNYFTTAESNTYGAAISASLQAQFGYGKSFIVDTSRNGNGSNGEWCNPAGRKIGTAPQVGGGAELLLWLKGPGTSDGPCGIAPTLPAGAFSPDLAIRLIDGV